MCGEGVLPALETPCWDFLQATDGLSKNELRVQLCKVVARRFCARCRDLVPSMVLWPSCQSAHPSPTAARHRGPLSLEWRWVLFCFTSTLSRSGGKISCAKKKEEVSPSHRPGATLSCWEGFLFLTVVFVPRKLPWGGVDKMGRLRSGAKRFLKAPLFDVCESLAPQEGTLQVRLGGTVRFDSCSVSV